MNKTFKAINSLILITLFSFIASANAQTLEINTQQNLVISNPGFYPFSSISNDQFKKDFSSNSSLNLQFSNFLGGPCAVAPAADFSEIGPQIVVNGNGVFLIDFSMSNPNVNFFGLSLVPETTNPCIFDLFISPPVATTSSSSGGVISGGGNDTLLPNSFTVFGGYLSDDLSSQLSNGPNNPQCQNSPFGLESITINGQGGDDTIQLIYNELGVLTTGNSGQRKFLNHSIEDEPEIFTLTLPENKKNAKAVHTQKLTNNTDITKVFATAIFASSSEESTIMLGANRLVNPDIEVTLKEQNLVALAAVQHALVSATMPWQLSQNGGYFITQGGGCVAPFCVIVEQGMIVVDPDGACNPEKLNKRKANYPTFNPSSFFEQITTDAVQLPTSSILVPKEFLDTKVVKDNAYLILQPVPPKAKIIQQLKFSLKKE